MERLKALEEVHAADARHQAFVRMDPETGGFVPLQLEDYHQWVSAIRLNASVPEDIRGYLETVKNVFVYGWFVYPFYAVAAFLSDTAVEMALRRRFQAEDPRGKWPLTSLLSRARAQRLIRDEGFAFARRQSDFRLPDHLASTGARPGASDYTDILVETIPKLRNSFAHPTNHTILLPGQAAASLSIAAEIINQLFPEAKRQGAEPTP